MIIKREEKWGILKYDTLAHRFSREQANGKDAMAYTQQPVVLNVDLTMKCNMACFHCVTKDFDQAQDLVVSNKLINWINKQCFMAVVITGGEPFLPEYEENLMTILREIHDKGLIIDTNGTIFPSGSVIDMIMKTNTLVRVSCDSVRPDDEIYFRQVKANIPQNRDINNKYYQTKIDTIKRLRSAGVHVAVQSVIHKKNRYSIVHVPDMLTKYSIKQWYIQRFIPSYKATDKKFEVSSEDYDEVTAKLIKKCKKAGIECITKKDRRHNSVILLVGDGLLFTQGEKPGKKVPLGTIDSDISYFAYVSSADHADRYYG
jgi:MoaA/NifB/PqqE/SkfB family radical SAM enzyme